MSMQLQQTSVGPVAIVQSDTTRFGTANNPVLKGLMVFSDGTLVIKNGLGTSVTITVPAVAAGGSFPFIIPGPITAVMATTTDIPDEDMIGIQ